MSKFEKWVHIFAGVSGLLATILGLMAGQNIVWEGVATLWVLNSWMNYHRGLRQGKMGK